MSATGKPRANGFTLIEALMVVAITALISGLAFPAMRSAIGGQEFRTARSGVELSLRETRAKAIRSGSAVAFRVMRGGTAIVIDGSGEKALPQSLRLAPVQNVTFFPDGTSNGATLKLGAQDRTASFIIFPTTGLITVTP